MFSLALVVAEEEEEEEVGGSPPPAELPKCMLPARGRGGRGLPTPPPGWKRRRTCLAVAGSS